MQVYLVGGAVRDEQLGIPVTERDWCVVGATETELLDAGYKRVGKSFPVFLHPVTSEEYALARTEKKTGPGYRGFSVDTAPTITLEEDLRRRDLTINALAIAENGTLVDPYGGLADLNAKVLRHVSPAYREDPLRVLRTARFAARFASLGFRVADETLALMSKMVDDGELNALVAERVWKETELALGYAMPQVFFSVLRECGASRDRLPRDRRPFRGASASEMASRNRLRHPHPDGAGDRRAARAQLPTCALRRLFTILARRRRPQAIFLAIRGMSSAASTSSVA